MPPTRRFEGTDSPTRSLLIDAAEELMQEEGYGAVTSRKLAQRAGVKHQTVYYYFRSMDDLFIAILDRNKDSFVERLNEALAAEHPIRALWNLASDRQSAKLELEFNTLALHREPIREAMARHLDSYRQVGIDALAQRFEGKQIDPIFSPIALAVLAGCVGRYLVLAESVGLSRGHEQTQALVEYLLQQVEQIDGKQGTAGENALRPAKAKTNRRPATTKPRETGTSAKGKAKAR